MACAGSASPASTETRGCGATWSGNCCRGWRCRPSVRGETRLRIWSAGCASGEEPYTLALMFALGETPKSCEPEVLATDADPHLLARARRACYPAQQPARAAGDMARRLREVRRRVLSQPGVPDTGAVPGAGYPPGSSGRTFRPRPLSQSGLHLLRGAAAGRHRRAPGRGARSGRAPAARVPRVPTRGSTGARAGAAVAPPREMP